MKITNYTTSFGFLPQKPTSNNNTLKNYQNNFDFKSYSKAMTLLNQNLVSFGKRIVLQDHNDEILKLHKEGKTVREIALIIGCSHSGINNYIRRCGFEEKGNKLELNKDTVIELYSEGKSIEEIIKITNLSKKQIKKTLRETGLYPKLTPAQLNKEKIVELYESGMSQKEIGNIIGCHQNTISHTLKTIGYDTKRKKRVDGVIEPNKNLIIRMYQQGETYRTIAEKFNCSQGAIEHAISRWNKAPRQYHFLRDYKDEIIKVYQMGASQTEIAEALGCSQTAICYLLKKWSVSKK